MAKAKDWKMLFGVENEYHTSRLAYEDRNIQSIIPHAMVAAAEEFGGFAEDIWTDIRRDAHKRGHASVRRYEQVSDNLRIKGLTGIRATNRMRIYVDLGHPEISMAECTNPRDLLLQQKASERMIERMRVKATQQLGLESNPILVSKNNSSGLALSDFDGVPGRGDPGDSGFQTWATHENYLIPPRLFEELTLSTVHYGRRIFRPVDLERTTPRAASWIAFLISRIYGGSGKTVSEMNRPPCDFQMFQRADFICSLRHLNTMQNRGLINMRDHPYADRRKYRRLHVICGDALIAPWSIYVTYGITALFLKMLAERFAMAHVSVKNPVETFWNVSRDLSAKKRLIELEGGATISALELQQKFLADMKRYLGTHENAATVFGDAVAKLEFVLNLFDANPERLKFYLDFAIKKAFLEIAAENSDATERQLLLESLNYHNTNPEEGTYFLLEKEGFEDGNIAGINSDQAIVTEAEIDRAITHPPEDSRAYFGGEIVRRFSKEIRHYSWDELAPNRGSTFLYDPWTGSKDQIGSLIEESSDLPAVLEKMRAL